MTVQPTVFLTGASTGIGAALAERLLAGGWRVLAGVRQLAQGKQVHSETSVEWLVLDLLDSGSIERAISEVRERCHSLDAIIHCAGTVIPAPAEFLPPEDFAEQMQVNVIGALQLTQGLLPLVRARRQSQSSEEIPSARILFTSSISGRVAFPFEAAYNASKFALEGLADTLRLELRPWGIPVVLLEPGPVATPIWSRFLKRWGELRSRLPAEAERLYGQALTEWEHEVRAVEAQAIAPAEAVEVFLKALAAKRPKARYTVGRSATRFAWLARLAPTKLVDRLAGGKPTLPE